MSLFRKSKKAGNNRQDELAGRMAKAIICQQTRIAAYLNHRTRNWSVKTSLYLLLVFCVVFVAINTYLIIHSI
ncbi:hypothetical protein [Pedobacter glucosidilyticus]|uniref:hypothetical protein n=1 Tax=Pedobacter glucosidilyticus TaxID=1122941 RepID=UPI0026F026B9|nr:hypothetical protein [Pedobacter glucosidilyticus]